MKKILLLFALCAFMGCGIPKETIGDCDSPAWVIIVYGNNEETYPTPTKEIGWLMDYHKDDAKKILYFCNDSLVVVHLDEIYPLIELNKGVLK